MPPLPRLLLPAHSQRPPGRSLALTAALAVAAIAFLLAQGLSSAPPVPSPPVPLPVQADFESSDGFLPGPFQPPAGWSVTGSAEVVMGAAPSGSQLLRLLPGEETPGVGIELAPHAEGGVVFVDFYLKPAAALEPELPVWLADGTAAVVAFVAAPDVWVAELFVVDGDGNGGGEWLATGFTLPCTADRVAVEWLRLTYRLDYETNRWDLFANGQLLLPDLGFVNQPLPTLRRFAIQGDRAVAVEWDALTIDVRNPLFADTSRDGLADDWLLAHGLDPSIPQREGDGDHDGLSTLVEAWLGTHPGLADTDGDGRADGVEFAQGTDPISPDPESLAGLPFEEDFETLAGLSLAGQRGWQVEGAKSIRVESAGESLAALLPPSPEGVALVQPLNGGTAPEVWTEFRLRAAPMEASQQRLPNPEQGAVAFYFDSEGAVWVFDRNEAGWRTFGKVPEPEEWKQITVWQDFVGQRWRLWIDGRQFAHDLPFANLVPYYQEFRVGQSGTRPAWIDAIRIGEVAPAAIELDRDLNGLPDAWESLYFGMIGVDPAGDPDGDGVRNEGEWQAGTHPLVPSDAEGALAFPFEEDFGQFAEGLWNDAAWQTSGLTQITEHAEALGGKVLELQEGEARVRVDGRERPVVWLDLRLRPARVESGLPAIGDGSAAAFFFDAEGRLHAFDGRGGRWMTVPGKPHPMNLPSSLAPEGWVRLSLRLDYASQTWSIWMDGVRAAEGLGFAYPRDFFSGFSLSSHQAGSLDYLKIGEMPPPGLMEPEADQEAPVLGNGPALVWMGEGRVRFHWEAATDNIGIEGYRVLRDGEWIGETPWLHFETELAAGEFHRFQIQAFDEWGNVSAPSPALELEGPTGAMLVGTGLKGAYFAGRNWEAPAEVRLDPQLDFRWANGVTPMGGLPDDDFQVRWTGLLEADWTGTHLLEVKADDGVRVWLDGTLVIDDWANGSRTQQAGVWLESGKAVPLVIEYYEAKSAAEIRLRLARPGSPLPILILPEQLYPAPAMPGLSSAAVGLVATGIEGNRVELAWAPGVEVPALAWHIYRDGHWLGRTWSRAWRDWEVEPSTAYTYVVRPEGFDGELGSESDPLSVVTAPNSLPEPWRHRDVGECQTVGQTAYDFVGERWAISGSGRDLFSKAPNPKEDGFHFVYQPLVGDFVLSAKVESFQANHSWAKAGLMVRADMAGESEHVSAVITFDNRSQILARLDRQSSTYRRNKAFRSAPSYVRIERRGNLFTTSFSPDGVQWKVEGTVECAMPLGVHVGMIISALDDELAHALFSDVSIEADSDGNGLPDWWELQHFSQLGVDPIADPDGDGATNQAEAQAGTDPQNYFHRPGSQVAPVLVFEPATPVSMTALTTLPLRVRVTDSLTGLPMAGLPLVATVPEGNLQLSTEPGGSPPSQTLELMTNAGGEILLHLHQLWPAAAQSLLQVSHGPLVALLPVSDLPDDDQLPDAWEVEHFGTLAYGDADDPDADTLSNLAEYQANTHPALADTEGAGDDGGVGDGFADDDGDGATNNSEQAAGFDPENAASHPDRPARRAIIDLGTQATPNHITNDFIVVFSDGTSWGHGESIATNYAPSKDFHPAGYYLTADVLVDLRTGQSFALEVTDEEIQILAPELHLEEITHKILRPLSVSQNGSVYGTLFFVANQKGGAGGHTGYHSVWIEPNGTKQFAEAHPIDWYGGTHAQLSSTGFALVAPYDEGYLEGVVLISSPGESGALLTPGRKIGDISDNGWVYHGGREDALELGAMVWDVSNNVERRLGVESVESPGPTVNNRIVTYINGEGASEERHSPEALISSSLLTGVNDVNGNPVFEDGFPVYNHYPINDLLQDKRYQVHSTYSINDHGAITALMSLTVDDNGNAIPPNQQTHTACILVPVDMAVDANRDGVIKFAGNYNDSAVAGKSQDKTEEIKPFRFWINSDNDGTGDGNEVLNSSADSADNEIKSTRDLEDFTRLHLYIGGVQDAVADGTFSIGLEWRNTNGTSPAIKVYRAAEPTGGNKYLTNESNSYAAILQTAAPFKTALGTVSSGGSFKLPSDFFQSTGSGIPAFSEDDPTRYLVFEGVGEGKGQLVMTFWKGSTKIGEGGGVWLDLVNVRKMYERAKARSNPTDIPNPQDSTSTPAAPSVDYVLDPWSNQWDYPSVSWTEAKDYIVFVHGWNTPYEDARVFFAESMFKRLWQRGYKGRFAALYWPTLVGVTTFNESEYRAWFLGESLKQYMASLPGGYSKNLVAHSMGNVLGGSALRKGMGVRNYAMIDAAVPASCYDDSSDLHQSFGSNSPDHDTDSATLALANKNKLASVGSANIINFYLASDDALDAWRLNQEIFRPQNLLQYR